MVPTAVRTGRLIGDTIARAVTSLIIKGLMAIPNTPVKMSEDRAAPHVTLTQINAAKKSVNVQAAVDVQAALKQSIENEKAEATYVASAF